MVLHAAAESANALWQVLRWQIHEMSKTCRTMDNKEKGACGKNGGQTTI